MVSTIMDVERIEATPLPLRDLPESTYAVLEHSAAIYPETLALRFFANASAFTTSYDWTYAELFADVTRAANVFSRLGIGPTDVIAFVLPNLPETHLTVWGGEAAGIAMAVNPLLDATQIADLLRIAQAKVLVTLAPTPDSNVWQKMAQLLPTLPTIESVLWVSMTPYVKPDQAAALQTLELRELSEYTGPKIYHFRSLLQNANGATLESSRRIESTAISSYFCTGGTTGRPKIAQRTHGSEVFDAWALARHLGNLGPGKVFFCGLPLFHVNGQLVTGLMPWMEGACVVLGSPDGYRGEGILDRFWLIVEHYKVSFFSCVPTICAALLRKPVNGDISSLEYALCGAAPMPVELFRQFEGLSGIKILEGYGLTEGACVSSVNPPAGERRVGSIGLRLAHQKMLAAHLDNAGNFIAVAEDDVPGTILINGPNIFAGYLESFHNQDLWVEINGERWLNTGDTGRQDQDGYFWLTGRKKELIIRGGHNIDPKQIEEAMQGHPSVALAAAIGSPDAYSGEVPVVYVQLRPDAPSSEEELLAFAKRSISERSAIPKRVEIISVMPLTTVGKIYKPFLQRLEIARVIQFEAASHGMQNVVIDVVEDTRRGLLARISAGSNQEELAQLLAGYAFQIDWLSP